MSIYHLPHSPDIGTPVLHFFRTDCGITTVAIFRNSFAASPNVHTAKTGEKKDEKRQHVRRKGELHQRSRGVRRLRDFYAFALALVQSTNTTLERLFLRARRYRDSTRNWQNPFDEQIADLML